MRYDPRARLSPKQQKWLLPIWGPIVAAIALYFMMEAVGRGRLPGAIAWSVLVIGALGVGALGLVIGKLIRGRTAIVALVVIAAVLAIPIVHVVVAESGRSSLWAGVSDVTKQLDHVCETGIGVPGAGALAPIERGRRPLVMYQTTPTGTWMDQATEQPREVLPHALAETQLVVCIDHAPPAVGKIHCPDGRFIDQITRSVRVVEARTGRVVETRLVGGTMDCRDLTKAYEGHFASWDVRLDQVFDGIRDLVEPAERASLAQ